MQAFSVLRLQVALQKVDTKRLHAKDSFMAELPAISNYLLDTVTVWTLDGPVTVGRIVKRFDCFHRSETPIKRHLSIINLSDRDKIGITDRQFEELEQLFK